MKIAVLHSEAIDADAYPADSEGRTNTDMMEDVVSELHDMGHTAFPVVADLPMFVRLLKEMDEDDIDLVFNISDDGFRQDASLEPQIPAFLDLIGLPYTGSEHLCLGTCLDKYRTKLLLRAHGIPTPDFALIDHIDQGLPAISDLTYPLIVKPSREDGSIGIRSSSVVEDRASLIEQCTLVIDRYRQPALVEEFLGGREFNVGILGRKEIKVLPLSEIMFTMAESSRAIVSYEGKWSPGSDDYRSTMGTCPADVDPGLERDLIDLARKAYDIMGVRDYGRIDLRLDADGRPQILEVNPNPDLSRDAGLARMALAADMSYGDLLENIIWTAYTSL